jgi:hypothetical protein
LRKKKWWGRIGFDLRLNFTIRLHPEKDVKRWVSEWKIILIEFVDALIGLKRGSAGAYTQEGSRPKFWELL